MIGSVCLKISEKSIFLLGTPLILDTSTEGDSLSEIVIDRTTLAFPPHARRAINRATINTLGRTKAEIVISNGRAGSVSITSVSRIKGLSALLKYPETRPTERPIITLIVAARKPTRRVDLAPYIHWLNTSCPMLVVPKKYFKDGGAKSGPTVIKGL